MCVRHVPGCLTSCYVCSSCSRLPHILLCVLVMFQVASHPAMCVRHVPIASHPAMCVRLVPGCLTSRYVCSYRSCSRSPYILLSVFVLFQVASLPAMCVRHVPGCLTSCYVCLSCSRLPHIVLCVFVLFQVTSHPAMCVCHVPGCLTSCYVCSYWSCSRLPHLLLCVFVWHHHWQLQLYSSIIGRGDVTSGKHRNRKLFTAWVIGPWFFLLQWNHSMFEELYNLHTYRRQ